MEEGEDRILTTTPSTPLHLSTLSSNPPPSQGSSILQESSSPALLSDPGFPSSFLTDGTVSVNGKMHQSREAGKWRWFPTSYRARLTLACSFIRSLVSLILVSVLLGQGINHVPFSMRQERIPQDDQVVCYSILLVAGPFSSILLWDALVHKNTIQVVAITGFDWFFLMYTSLLLMYTQKSWSRYWMDHPVQEARTILLILLPILALSCILLSLGARSIYREFGWTVFKQLGADRSVRRKSFHLIPFPHFLLLLLLTFPLISHQFNWCSRDVQDLP